MLDCFFKKGNSQFFPRSVEGTYIIQFYVRSGKYCSKFTKKIVVPKDLRETLLSNNSFFFNF